MAQFIPKPWLTTMPPRKKKQPKAKKKKSKGCGKRKKGNKTKIGEYSSPFSGGSTKKSTRESTIPVQIDQSEPLEPQITALVGTVGLSSEEWQTRPLLINPPGYAPAAFVLLAELHGRIGHFPSLIRLRPVADSTPTAYEVAELINLQAIREAARKRR